MVSISFQEAKKLAYEYVCQQECDFELVILDDKTLEEEFGWVFFYTTKKYLETGNFRDLVGGNAPIIIDKETGQLTETGTAYGVDHYIEEYRVNRK
jgi:hypothetical protein